MPVRKTKDEFIKEAKIIHKNKYDYSKVEYENSKKNVIIICPIHGSFEKSPNHHLKGQGCRTCKGYIKLTIDSFLERAKKTHGEKYDYQNTVVKSKSDKIEINCPIHGPFFQLPNNHYNGQGCPECAQISRSISQRYSIDEFLRTVKNIHGEKYDYSKVNYLNSQTKVVIICPIHGEFKIKPNSHYNGHGCSQCGRIQANENIALDYSVFLDRAEKVHENRYQYLEESYVNYTTKMEILCSEHGFFSQTPHSHISMKTGCPKCGVLSSAQSSIRKWDIVLGVFREVHGERYIYDETSYIKLTEKMRIKCEKHGWFEQLPHEHCRGSGCNKCAIEEVHENQKISFEDFVGRAREKHGNRYKYFIKGWNDIFTPVRISCDKHGNFYQVPRNHYRGSGCPKCISSRGENEVRKILKELNIEFTEQKRFKGLKLKASLKCDFYLPKYNTVIEYNGIQHYEAIEVFGGIKALEYTQKRDIIKYTFLKKNGIDLIIIRYDNDDIRSIILEKLKIREPDQI